MPVPTEYEVTSPHPRDAAGLLDRIAADAFDGDYQVASQRRSADGATRSRGIWDQLRRPGERRAVIAVSALTLLAFGVLVVTAGIETQRSEVVRQTGRQALINQIEERKSDLAALNDRADALSATIAEITAAYLLTSAEGRNVEDRLLRLSMVGGSTAVTGPGVRIVVDNAGEDVADGGVVLDRDLQLLVNALWQAGAEAIAINGQRITSLTAIRHAGRAITVNFRSLSRPYVIDAIGNPDTLPATLIETPGGTAWLDLQVLYGLRFEVNSADKLVLPGLGRLDLRYARRGERVS